jgi:tartrate-resistant acid phosphatase type 5
LSESTVLTKSFAAGWRAVLRLTTLALLLATAATPQTFHTYIGNLDHDSVTIAWGTTRGGGNTIGRNSKSHGKASVRIAGRNHPSNDRNWVHVTGLQADHDYDYEVFVGNERIGAGSIRTWPANPSKLAFLVIGDYGNDKKDQHRIAAAMWREFLRRSQTDNPIRFVLTTGDNIYGWGVWPILLGSGDRDSHWRKRFFVPYEEILRRVPFYPTLGNHDCAESESRGDLEVYLDNFFFPDNRPAQHYKFTYGNLVEFFALDTTTCALSGDDMPNYLESGEQFQWMRAAIPASKAAWKLAYFHHPPFTAGPEHDPFLDKIGHFVKLFRESGVQAVFNGHEHNFQYAEKTETTGNSLYVVTGAGGELRDKNITSRLRRAGIAGFANQRHFLSVEVDRGVMKIMPLGDRPIKVIGPDSQPRQMPLVVNVK